MLQCSDALCVGSAAVRLSFEVVSPIERRVGSYIPIRGRRKDVKSDLAAICLNVSNEIGQSKECKLLKNGIISSSSCCAGQKTFLNKNQRIPYAFKPQSMKDL
jgi:hypothetical protein